MADRPGVYVVYTRYARTVGLALKLGHELAPVLERIAAREARLPRNEEGPRR
ncbi:hypothetical protein [Micromonospora sp. CB01531]|uniref:hypothetical protein n=1 Tax=Micromonospora sp. CB01531 TaxID=1718947 RepID=UPI000A70F908|nr:hypothetical protein [Micromonospora sp. CB01531]